MKKLLLLVTLALCAPIFTACSTPPSARVVQVQTLKAVGQAAESTVVLAGHLYAGGTITAAQDRAVNTFYDTRFQPAFRLAVAAVNANLDSVASSDIAALGLQLSDLLASFTQKPSP